MFKPSAMLMLATKANIVGYCAAMLMVSAAFAAPEQAPGSEKTAVIYAWSEAMADDPRGHYPIDLLKLALARSGENYIALPSKHELGQYRTLRHVQLERDLDVVWTFTTTAREQELLPIRIPIDRGLLGWRLLLINSQDQQKFDSLSMDELKQLRSGQGHDWPDLNVLQQNGFNVFPSSSYSGLFSMLKRRRISYFPRSATEIWPEVTQHHEDGVSVDSHWALYYPAPLYFFVSHGKPQLAAAIEKGLRAAMADGSMKLLFLKHFSDSIDKSALHSRTVVTLTNPDLPKATPLTEPELWFNPQLGY
ncbi:transporter substrate-binding domain-containing protein [Rheinheimera aquimaris]|uniref:Transporter substrate-binding domain-containing protein n=2 Tax=Rheinheimera TaxID=67575 RepID=A0ABP3NWN6_9GAMM|nr:transporter substrate-binding domain-containing protein [Rheinheimera aquimaris]MCB5214103.1 transporter substrate-binding domain-containing protein [Rheinheimera aquimaris]